MKLEIKNLGLVTGFYYESMFVLGVGKVSKYAKEVRKYVVGDCFMFTLCGRVNC